MQAAKYLNVPVTSLPDVPIWWVEKALTYMSAEGEAQKILADRK